MTKENKKLLQELYIKHIRIQYPTSPDYAMPMEKFSDASANELTKTICKFITYIGGQAERISNQGQYRDNTKTVTDVLGRKRTIGSGQWTKGQGTNGTADISAMYRGKSYKIEVKFGKDKMSEAQHKYKESVERAGAIYMIAKDFDTFIDEFRNYAKKKT
jgi:hypothetical protein